MHSFCTGDIILASLGDEGSIEGEVIAVTGVDTAKIKTKFSTFTVPMSTATLVKANSDLYDDVMQGCYEEDYFDYCRGLYHAIESVIDHELANPDDQT